MGEEQLPHPLAPFPWLGVGGDCHCRSLGASGADAAGWMGVGEAMKPEEMNKDQLMTAYMNSYLDHVFEYIASPDGTHCSYSPLLCEINHRLQEGAGAKKALEKIEKYLGESLERFERFMKEAESGEEKEL